MSVLQPQAIQELGDRASREDSPVLSVYLNLDPCNPVNRRGGYRLALDNLLKGIELQIKDDGKSKHFQEDAEWVRQRVEFNLPKGKSLVLFCDASESFFFEEPLPVRLANQVWYSATPYVRVLREVVEEHARYGVVLVDRERARFFVVTMGQIEEVSDVFQDPPFKHRSTSGSDQMRSQMVLQRRAAQWSEWFLKDAADILYGIINEYQVDGVLLAGPEEVTAVFQRLLPKTVAAKVVKRIRVSVTAKAGEVLELVFPVIEQIEREQELSLVEDLITIARKSNPTVEKAVLGMSATLDAVNQGRVYRLVYPCACKSPGCQCGGCDVLLDHAPGDGKCPYCSTSLEEVDDLFWYASERVLNLGGRTEEIRGAEARTRLESAGMIGAFLR